jgi:outer membrane immunogenic protein
MLKRVAMLAVCLGLSQPVLAVPASADQWSGFYIGGHAGGGAGRLDGTTQDLEGAVAGGHIGYNWQGANVVFGIEADLSWADYDLTTRARLGAFTVTSNAQHDYLTSVRGRLGFTGGALMVYGTAGIAYTEIETSLALTGPGASTLDKTKTDVGGIIGGLGFEYAIAPNIALRTEALWFDLHQDFDTADPGYNGYEVRAGISYFFK